MKINDAIIEHAKQCYPRESCGLIVVVKGRKKYIPCRNIAPRQKDFAIHPEDYASAEDAGKIVMIVHSHPNQSPKPSEADLIGCENSKLPWLIVSYPSCEMHEFKPSGYSLPLYGREFNHGTVDCYTFIRDYYKQVLSIDLPYYERNDNWWLGGDNLYIDNMADAGFYEVNDLQEHDVLYMTVASQVPNHGAVYLGDGKIGHHQTNRLSSVDVYGGWYQKITTHILRHKNLL